MFQILQLKKKQLDLKIKADILSTYYNWWVLKGWKYHYRIYKQDYYGDNYWNNCYWGCYWEPTKNYVTEWKWKLSEDWNTTIEIPVNHKAKWNDYKYLVEVTVTDINGAKVTGSNSIIVKIPESEKSKNPKVDMKLLVDKQFVEKWDEIQISLNSNNKWDEVYNDQRKMVIVKRTYTTKNIKNTAGRIVPQVDFEDEEIISKKINDKNFDLDNNNNILTYDFDPNKTGEYIVKLVDIADDWTMEEQEIYVYNDKITNVPVLDDNKLRVLSEKTSYKLWETARFLIRLPFENAKILITTEKTHVVDKKIIDIKNNIYLSEFIVDETFVPNAYLSFIAFEKGWKEYKVGYSEIVVDKSEKKLSISSTLNKEEYSPSEWVTLNLESKDINWEPVESELAVMVIDEALIAMIWNIDMDILKKFYKKLAFQTDTTLTSVAMMYQAYFARKGIAGWSWNKWWDNSVFTRTIFKNTAYYNGSVITDKKGKATINFALPDNIWDFRVIVLWSSKTNLFWAHENNLSVRQQVLIEDNFPMIFRQGDEMKLGVNVFNNWDKDIEAEVVLESTWLNIEQSKQTIKIKAENRKFITWDSSLKNTKDKSVTYSVTIKADNGESDKIQKTVSIAETPLIASYSNFQDKITKSKNNLSFKLSSDKVLNKTKSYIKFSISTSLLAGIEKILSSLMVYPHGCLEQLSSTTLPNALLLKFSNILDTGLDQNKMKENIKYGVDKIFSMQQSTGWFGYWAGDSEISHHYSPYAIWALATMKNLWADIDQKKLDLSHNYLKERFKNKSWKLDNYELSEYVSGLSALSKLNSSYFKKAREVIVSYKDKFTTHDKIMYTLALAEYDSSKYHNEIKTVLKDINLNSNSYGYNYWNVNTYKALYIQVLMIADSSNPKIDTLIKELYSLNLNSYYYSTQTKTQSFIAFIKYMDLIKQYKSATNVSFNISGNKWKLLLSGNKILKTKKIYLSDINSDEYNFNFSSKTDDNVYVDATLVAYPKDLKEVESESNWATVSREIFAVEMDDEKENYWDKNIKEIEVDQNILKIGETYLVKLKIKFDSDQRDVAIEDYLPGGIKVLNSIFKTNSSAVDDRRNWWSAFNHVEYKKDQVFATASRVRKWQEYEFRYFITPTVEGEFTNPPVSVYPMYNPEVSAHTGYSELKIKK